MDALVYRIISDDNNRLQRKVLKLKNKLSNISKPETSDDNIMEIKAENIKLKEENIKLKNLNNDIISACKLFNTSVQKLSSYICTNNKKIGKIFKSCKYEKLLFCSEFDVEYLFKFIRDALQEYNMDDDILKHIVDNCLDLNVEVNAGHIYTSNRLIHLFCRYASSESIKYLIDKGVELECQEKDGDYPIHLVCRKSTPYIIEYVIAMKVNTKSNPKIDLVEIINKRAFSQEEKNKLISLIGQSDG